MRSDMEMSFSIVIPTFNNLHSLKNTLRSVNNLIVPKDHKVELVIVDNNSDDGTSSYCKEFAETSKLPLRYCFEAEQGVSHARNRGVKECSNNIIIFADADVLVPENWLTEYIRNFEQEAPDCVFGRIIPEWNGDKPKWYDDSFSAVYGSLDYGDRKLVIRSRNLEFYGANFAIRKNILLELGGFDPNLGRTPDKLYISEERQIFLRLVELQKRIVYNPESFVYHVVSDRMRQKEYIKKYYHDTAYSLVYISNINTNRQLCGIPYYRLCEFVTFFATFVPRLLLLIIKGNLNKLFPLKLEFLRKKQMLYLYYRKAIADWRKT